MKEFKYIYKLQEHIELAFSSFYNTMLNQKRLSIFFKNQEQIKYLIKKQKEHFKLSLNMDIKSLKNLYVKLGEYHYELRIPYIDFIKGTEILQEHFLLKTQNDEVSIKLMDEIFEYFKIMKAYTAKGYLNKMLREDKKDLEDFFKQSIISNDNTFLSKTIVLENFEWLRDMLSAIEDNKSFNINKNKKMFEKWIEYTSVLPREKRSFFEDLEKRILINTQNLFYFLEKEEYLELLPLYTSLLSIYKLTLMVNNAITIEHANIVIENMKYDNLTKLFRKDIFEEILKKEMALAIRNPKYRFCVIFLDVDNFKKVNDTYGHYSGDKVLEKVGEIIKSSIRSSDIGFRIGGDEFAIILKNTSKENAQIVAKKIQSKFTQHKFIFNDRKSFFVNISIGIDENNSQELESFEDFIKRVDRNLYKAKELGKNQIYL